MNKEKFFEKVEKEWKYYLKQFGIFLSIMFVGILIGRTTTEVDTIKQIIVNTVSGVIINLPLFILIYIGVNMIVIAIKNAGNQLVKNIPKWLIEYERIKSNNRIVEQAIKNKIK